MRPPLFTAALAASLCLACASPGTQDPFAPKTKADQVAPRPAPGLTGGRVDGTNQPDVLAVVAGDAITTEDFLARLMHRESRTVFDTIDRQVTARLALLEAGRLGIKLDPAIVDAQVAAERDSMESILTKNGYAVDRYLREELGLDPNRYFQLMRDEAVEQLMIERVMRSWMLGQPRVILRVIVTEDEEALQASLERLQAGDDFATIAAGVSIDPSAQDGGLLPPMVQSELSPMSRLAFQTPVGGLGGPIEQDGRFILLQPVEVFPAEVGSWAELGPKVEADLAENPPLDPEYWQWRAAMGRRYQVDLSPLLDFAGEPLLPKDA